jgi:dynein heavy chain
LIELVRGNLDSIRRKIIVALVTTDVHARDIVENLVKQKMMVTFVPRLEYNERVM